METIVTKKCSKCKETKLVLLFNKHPNIKDGYRPDCKACQAKSSVVYRSKNKDVIRAKNKEYQLAHPEKSRERSLRCYHKNPEREKRWRQSHAEIKRAATKKWCAKNKDKVQAMKSARRAREMLADGSFTEKEWMALKNKHNNKCLCCGEQKPLTVDHVIPLSKGGTNHIENIQPLCRECNSKKNIKDTDYRCLQQ